ncbi:MAG: SDR family oxidoreductase [Myxococcales bacterium]|nr:SDR family oxidoreductase [Myxococcales bacterium]
MAISFDLTDRRLLVIGASSGVGRALGKLASQAGARVAFASRRKERLVKVAAEVPGEAIALPCDVRHAEDCARVVAPSGFRKKAKVPPPRSNHVTIFSTWSSSRRGSNATRSVSASSSIGPDRRNSFANTNEYVSVRAPGGAIRDRGVRRRKTRSAGRWLRTFRGSCHWAKAVQERAATARTDRRIGKDSNAGTFTPFLHSGSLFGV